MTFAAVLVAIGTSALADDLPPCIAGLPKPDYPPLALQARVHGTVRIRFGIDVAGKPVNVTSEGHPLLTWKVLYDLEKSVIDPEKCGGRSLDVSYLFLLGSPGDGSTVVSFEEPATVVLTAHPKAQQEICVMVAQKKSRLSRAFGSKGLSTSCTCRWE